MVGHSGKEAGTEKGGMGNAAGKGGTGGEGSVGRGGERSGRGRMSTGRLWCTTGRQGLC